MGEVQQLQDSLEKHHQTHQELGKKLESLRTELQQLDELLGSLGVELTANRQQREEKELEQKRLTHKIQQLQKDDKDAHVIVAKMEQEHPWIEKEKQFFGK